MCPTTLGYDNKCICGSTSGLSSGYLYDCVSMTGPCADSLQDATLASDIQIWCVIAGAPSAGSGSGSSSGNGGSTSSTKAISTYTSTTKTSTYTSRYGILAKPRVRRNGMECMLTHGSNY